MAINHVQNAGENGATPASFGAAVAPADLVCVLFGHGTGTVISMTDDQSNSHTIFASGTAGGGTVGVAFHANITNRPRTVPMNGSGLAYLSLIIDELSGAGAFDIGNSIPPTANSAALPSGAIAPAQNGELLYAGSWAVGSASLSIGSSSTHPENAGSYGNEPSACQVQGTAAPVAANFTPSNGSDTGFAAILATSPAGSPQNIVADAVAPAEAVTAVISDTAAAMEMLTSFLPAPLWIEWAASSSGFSANRDNLLPIEVLATAPVGYIQIESLARLPPPDGAAPFPPLSLRLEFVEAARREAALLVEWLGATGGNIVADVAADLEWRARQTGDAMLSTEATAAALREALLPLEILSMGLVAATVDSPVPIAVTAPIRTDAALPNGWSGPISVTSDAPMLFEIIGEKPSSLPAIPQVSGRRLRLFRV